MVNRWGVWLVATATEPGSRPVRDGNRRMRRLVRAVVLLVGVVYLAATGLAWRSGVTKGALSPRLVLVSLVFVAVVAGLWVLAGLLWRPNQERWSLAEATRVAFTGSQDMDASSGPAVVTGVVSDGPDEGPDGQVWFVVKTSPEGDSEHPAWVTVQADAGVKVACGDRVVVAGVWSGRVFEATEVGVAAAAVGSDDGSR
jgi:hypothetical protein